MPRKAVQENNVALWPPDDDFGGDVWEVIVWEGGAEMRHEIAGYENAKTFAIQEGKRINVVPWAPTRDGEASDVI